MGLPKNKIFLFKTNLFVFPNFLFLAIYEVDFIVGVGVVVASD